MPNVDKLNIRGFNSDSERAQGIHDFTILGKSKNVDNEIPNYLFRA